MQRKEAAICLPIAGDVSKVLMVWLDRKLTKCLGEKLMTVKQIFREHAIVMEKPHNNTK